MTETEWLACTEPTSLLEFMRRRAIARRLRLAACACCRSIWPLLSADSRQAVEIAEGHADGHCTDLELKWANTRAGQAMLSAEQADAAEAAAWASAGNREAGWAEMAAERAGRANSSKRQAQADLVRDIFGNPFRPVEVKESWRTRRVVMLAQTIYDERAFERMPELADVLVGRCHSKEILNHCRGPGMHVRGCWALDLLLGKDASPPARLKVSS